MSAHPPPVPPANRSPQGGEDKKPGASEADPRTLHENQPHNTEEQGRQGNIHQNTTHSGHQQDR